MARALTGSWCSAPAVRALCARGDLTLASTDGGLDHTLTFERIEGGAGNLQPALRIEVLIAAYLTGIAQAATQMAVEYSKTREQFGQPIGAFQAIKHSLRGHGDACVSGGYADALCRDRVRCGR